MKTSITFVVVASAAYADAQPPGTISPLVEACGSSTAIACVNKYASVMPYPFYRRTGVNGSFEDTFASTSVPNDTSFGLVSQADFLVFDRERGLELLGSNPSYEFMFHVNDGEFEWDFGHTNLIADEMVLIFKAVHEAPVYVPATNKLYFSQLRGETSPPGFLPQLVVNLNIEPPVLGELLSDPPIYAPNGGTFYDGL